MQPTEGTRPIQRKHPQHKSPFSPHLIDVNRREPQYTLSNSELTGRTLAPSAHSAASAPQSIWASSRQNGRIQGSVVAPSL